MATSANSLENPLQKLQKLAPALLRSLQGHTSAGPDSRFTQSQTASLSTGIPAIDRQLPDGGLPRGALIELAVQGAAFATTLGLKTCVSAQQEAEALGGSVPWCVFIDPSRSLYAPGVAHVGVRLERLLVVRPPLEALSRVALRLVESQCFAVVVIDTIGLPGGELNVSLGGWPRIVRRLALALQGTQSTVLLLTDHDARRPLTLPVAQRIELCRPQAHKLILRVAKDRQGRVSAQRSILLRAPGAHDAPEARWEDESTEKSESVCHVG